MYNRGQQLVVNLIKAVPINIKRLERISRNGHIDGAVAFDHSKIAHTAQQGIGNARRAATTHSYLKGRIIGNGNLQQRRTAPYNALQGGVIVIFEMAIDTETRTQGSRQQAAASGGTHERKRTQ